MTSGPRARQGNTLDRKKTPTCFSYGVLLFLDIVEVRVTLSSDKSDLLNTKTITIILFNFFYRV